MTTRSVYLSVACNPVALARARVGKYGQIYTPRESLEAQQQIGLAWKVLGEKPFEKGAPLELTVWAWLKRPKRPKYEYPLGPPDGTNILKNVEDALQKCGAIPNDSQFITVTASKEYDSVARLEIDISEHGAEGWWTSEEA